MRLAVGILATLIVLAVVGLVALAIALPRIAESAETRARIEQASIDVLARPLSYDSLSVGILPPRIVLSSPHVPGGTPDAPPLFRAKRVDLQIALLPLLGLSVVIDSLVIEGLEIEVTRTDSGFDLPQAPGRVESVEATEPGQTPAESGTTLLDLGIRRLTVHDARLLVIDRTLSPAVTLGFHSLEFEARGESVDDPIRVEAHADLATGGRVVMSGTTTVAAVLDMRFELHDAKLADTGIYVGQGADVDATLSGTITLRGDVAAPSGLNVDVVLAARRIVLGTTTVEGPVAMKAELGGEWAALSGGFSIDATPVRIASSADFVKPAGTPASVKGRLEAPTSKPGPEGHSSTRVTLERLELASLLAHGHVDSGTTVRVALDADPFPIAGLLALSPDAADMSVTGELALDGFEARLEPLSLAGELRLEGLRFGLESGGAVALDGRMIGRGDQVDLADVVISTGGQRVLLSGRVRQLSGEMPFSMKLASDGVLRANSLMTGLDPSTANTVYGPLTLRGDLSGRASSAGGETAMLDSLVGDLELDMGRSVGDGSEGGRIVGFSLLGSVFAGLQEFGDATHLSGLLNGVGAPDITKFSNDAFDTVRVVFRVRDGQLETEQARLVYAHYGANLRGTIELVDLSLDMKGDVQLGSEVAAVLGARAKDGEIVVPIAHIGGTVDKPDVSVSKTAVVSLTSQIVKNNVAIKGVVGEAEKVVPGAGRILGDGFGAILGAGRGGGAAKQPDRSEPPAAGAASGSAEKGSQ